MQVCQCYLLLLDSKEHMKNKYAIMNYKYDCSYDHQK